MYDPFEDTQLADLHRSSLRAFVIIIGAALVGFTILAAILIRAMH